MKKNVLLTGMFLLASISISWAQGTPSTSSGNFSPQESRTSANQRKALSPAEIYKMQESAVFKNIKKGGKPTDAQLATLRQAYQKAVEQTRIAKESGIAATQAKGTRSIVVGEGGWRMTSQVTKDADGNPISEVIYTYDNKGREVLALHNDIEGTNTFPSWKAVTEYDDNGNQTLDMRQTYNRETQEWYTTFQRNEEYNADGIQTLLEIYYYDYNQLETYLAQRRQSLYDERGNLLAVVDFGGKNSASDHYQWGSKYEYTYDEHNRETSYVSSYMNGNDEFVNYVKLEYAYNQLGYKTDEARYEWTNEQWQGTHAEGTYYDEYGNWYGYYNHDGWDATSNIWASGSKSIQKAKGGYWTSNNYTWIPSRKDWVCNSEQDVELDSEGRATLWYLYNYDVAADGTTTFNYGYRDEMSYDGNITYTNQYSRSSAAGSWIFTGAYASTSNENGLASKDERFNSSKELESTTFYEWKYLTWGTEYNDVYLRGKMTNWAALDEYKMTDLHDGTLELYNITIKKDDEFKFADAEWQETNWGGNVQVGENQINYNERTFLTSNGGNLMLNMDADEVLIKKITLNFLTGELYMEYDATTAVNQVAADGSTITVQGNKIVTVGAKNVKVYSADGTLVSRQAVTSVQPGMYIVKADAKVIKVQVK